MIDQEVGTEVRKIVGLVLGRAIAENEEVSREVEPRWESLKHVEILFAIEDAFAVQFPEDEMHTLNSIARIVAAVESHDAA